VTASSSDWQTHLAAGPSRSIGQDRHLGKVFSRSW
jgi:hypothetical protein